MTHCLRSFGFVTDCFHAYPREQYCWDVDFQNQCVLKVKFWNPKLACLLTTVWQDSLIDIVAAWLWAHLLHIQANQKPHTSSFLSPPFLGHFTKTGICVTDIYFYWLKAFIMLITLDEYFPSIQNDGTTKLMLKVEQSFLTSQGQHIRKKVSL